MRKGICVIMLLTCVGCGALFGGGMSQKVTLNSNPAGATYTVTPGGQTGTTPATVSLPKKGKYIVLFQMQGYEDQSIAVGREVNTLWLVLDIFGGLIWVVVDGATGAWYELDPDVLNPNLKPILQ